MCRAKNWVRNASIEELSARLGQFGLMPLARHSSRRDKALRKEDLESVGMVVETDIDGKAPLLDHPYFWAPFVVMVH
jgi:CHAT domain-containing protein